jgi:hypothetical protein
VTAKDVFQSALNTTIDTLAYPGCSKLLERATALVDAGKIPCISLNGLSFSHQTKPEFKEYRTRIYQLHRNPAYAVGACLHEAGHAVLMEEDGVQNVKFSGPGILRKADGSLFPYGARVDGDPQANHKIDSNFIFVKTTHMVVGGIAMQKYAGINEVSDGEDHRMFLSNCATTPEFFKDEKPEALWARATRHVELWLERADVESRILAKAAEYLEKLYS